VIASFSTANLSKHYRRDADMLMIRIMTYLAVFLAAVILVIGWIGGKKP